MELRKPKRKKFMLSMSTAGTQSHLVQLSGIFNGLSVVVDATRETRNILEACCFGKPNLSRCYNSIRKGIEIVRGRQFEHRKKISGGKSRVDKVIVLPDSDSEDDEYFNKEIRPVYHLDTSVLKEKIHLELAEAYFLNKYVGCLKIQHNDVILNSQQCWAQFSVGDKYFVQNYICYHHFRRKNWVVKPGLKFGGDYLLYKDGPAFYHASYIVIIDILSEDTLERRTDLCRRSMNTRNIVGLNRLCESTGKELLIFQIIWPQDVHLLANDDDIKHVKVKEILMRRWDPNSKQLN